MPIQNMLQSDGVVIIFKIVFIDQWLCIRSFGFFNKKQRHCLSFSVLEKEHYLGKFKSCLFDIVKNDRCVVSTI